jgi:hypothetical protein
MPCFAADTTWHGTLLSEGREGLGRACLGMTRMRHDMSCKTWHDSDAPGCTSHHAEGRRAAARSASRLWPHPPALSRTLGERDRDRDIQRELQRAQPGSSAGKQHTASRARGRSGPGAGRTRVTPDPGSLAAAGGGGGGGGMSRSGARCCRGAAAPFSPPPPRRSRRGPSQPRRPGRARARTRTVSDAQRQRAGSELCELSIHCIFI